VQTTAQSGSGEALPNDMKELSADSGLDSQHGTRGAAGRKRKDKARSDSDQLSQESTSPAALAAKRPKLQKRDGTRLGTLLLKAMDYPDRVYPGTGWWKNKMCFKGAPEASVTEPGTWIWKNHRVWLMLPLEIGNVNFVFPVLVDTGAPTGLAMSEGCLMHAKKAGILTTLQEDDAHAYIDCKVNGEATKLEVDLFEQSGDSIGAFQGRDVTCEFILLGSMALLEWGLDVPFSKIKEQLRKDEADMKVNFPTDDIAQVAQQLEVKVVDEIVRTWIRSASAPAH